MTAMFRPWCLLLLLPALASSSTTERDAAALVDPAVMTRTVRELVAVGPRMGGTPSGDAAAAHVAALFRALGLETRVVDDAPVRAHWEDRWTVEILPGGTVESAYPYGFSPTIDPPREGRLVSVPDLVRATPDPSWADAVIVTASRIGTVYPALARSPARPLAVMTSAPNDPAKNLDWARLGSLRGTNNTFPVFAVSYLDGRTLANAALEGARVRIGLVSHERQAPPRTVIATIAGKNPERYYLVSAHGDSDSGGPGADDNASGVATVVEVARVLAKLAATGRFTPSVSIRFVVWGAEYDSARSYIQREGAALERCAGVINFDETGTGAEREAVYAESNDVPWNAPMLREFQRVGEDYLDQPGFWEAFTTNPSQGGSDSYAFLPREYKGTGYTPLKIPATTVYTAAWDVTGTLVQTPGWESKAWREPGPLKIDYSAYYHSAGDLPANTTDREPQNMARAARLTVITLLRLLGSSS